MNKYEFQRILKSHVKKSRDIGKHFLKIGKRETSVIIKHEAIIINGETKLKTKISVLPVRRMYNKGSKIVDEEYLLYEMQEDIEV